MTSMQFNSRTYIIIQSWIQNQTDFGNDIPPFLTYANNWTGMEARNLMLKRGRWPLSRQTRSKSYFSNSMILKLTRASWEVGVLRHAKIAAFLCFFCVAATLRNQSNTAVKGWKKKELVATHEKGMSSCQSASLSIWKSYPYKKLSVSKVILVQSHPNTKSS